MATAEELIHEGSTARVEFTVYIKNPSTGVLTAVTDATVANIKVYSADDTLLADKNLPPTGTGTLKDNVVNEGNGVYATHVTVGDPGRYRAVGYFTIPGDVQINMPKKWTVHPLT